MIPQPSSEAFDGSGLPTAPTLVCNTNLIASKPVRLPPNMAHLSCLWDDHHPLQIQIARQLIAPHLQKKHT
jgi:hypothetical protein